MNSKDRNEKLQREADEIKKSAHLNNMGTQNLVYAGFDWLRTYSCGRFESTSLIEMLFQKRNEALRFDKEQEVWLDEDTRIFVQPVYGWGRGANQLSIVFHWQGLRIGINRRLRGDDEKKIEILATGAVLTELGLDRVRELSLIIKAKLCFVETVERVADVHFACDVLGTSVKEIYDLAHNGHMVTRAKDYNLHGKIAKLRENDAETFYLGNSAKKKTILCRIYNKTIELSKDPLKEEVYHRCIVRDKHLNGDVVRLEFELSRNALRERNIDTWQDLVNSAEDLLSYLCIGWVRVHDEPVNRKHTFTKQLARCWKSFYRGFVSFAESLKKNGNSVFKRVKRVAAKFVRKMPLLNLMRGYLANYFVGKRVLPTAFELGKLLLESEIEIKSRFHERFQKKFGQNYFDYVSQERDPRDQPKEQASLTFS